MRKSLEVRHDLEDTLRIGASIIELVAEVMRNNMDMLSADAKRRCIGQNFEESLKVATEGVEEIKIIHAAIQNSG